MIDKSLPEMYGAVKAVILVFASFSTYAKLHVILDLDDWLGGPQRIANIVLCASVNIQELQ